MQPEGMEDGLMRGWMSGASWIQTPPRCSAGIMITGRKHRALNGITQGDVNLKRAGGELKMIRGLQGEAWRMERGDNATEGRDTKSPQSCSLQPCSHTDSSYLHWFYARNWTRRTRLLVRPS